MTDAADFDRPDFIYPGGSPLMHPPLQLNRSRMYGFFVRGDLARLQATVDQALTAAGGGAMRFQVLSPFVMLTFTQVQHAQSAWPADAAKGWGEETDIVTWVMVGQVLAGQAGVSRVFFYPCHIWVDDCMALINGRELFGYPKYACEHTMPAEGEPATRFTLAAKGFQPFGPGSKLQVHPLLELEACGTGDGLARELAGLPELAEQAIALMAANLPGFLALDAAGWTQIAQMLRSPNVAQIFLKQLPDAAGVKAVYQALVAAPANVKTVRRVQLLGGDWQCTLHPFASFPLDRTLGLALGGQPALLPFHLDMDFEVPAGEVLHDNSRVAPKKIAILGGGVAAMTAAFYLSDQPGWRNRHDLTVYQMGWRLGGKGASGRNAALGQRIEEHGLHIWFGFYDNAFKTIQRAYALLDRPEGTPLRTWRDAFKPQQFIALTEQVRGQWRTWPIETPPMPGEPGEGSETLDLWRIVQVGYAWIKEWLGELRDADDAAHPAIVADTHHGSWLHRLAQHVEDDVAALCSDVGVAFAALQRFSADLPAALADHDPAHHGLQSSALQCVRAWLHGRFDALLDRHALADELRRLYICADLGLTCIIGMIEDGVLTQGFDVINGEDFQAWLLRHGANPDVTVRSAPVVGFYDLVFAYEDGNFDKPNIEAGTMLRGMLRVALGYHGAIMWKMQAGMGDVVFTPFYQLLKQRGVKFEFFHRVDELLPDASGRRVGEIRMTQQVALADPAAGYDPLVEVEGLACWPSAPRDEQLDAAQAALLRRHGINLESNWSDWPEVYAQAFGRPLPTRTLRLGVDFDQVIFGISAASVASLCPQLVARSPALAASCAHVKAVATQAYQVWLNADLRQLGWTAFAGDGQAPVLSAFSEPFDTWAPMDQLLCRERWPASIAPKNVSYFCSALPLADYPPYSDRGFPARIAAQVKQAAIEQLQRRIGALWPQAVDATGFRWPLLVDPSEAQGAKRFDSQYWRANVDPSERYVLSVVGSSRHRLATDGTGFANLFVTGDWIRTGLNAGCVEAATMAGMQTARAIGGHPALIVGEKDV